MLNTDQQLSNGSILRVNPRTGSSRVVSAADAARTALTRERDAELSAQAGAPPIAKGPVANTSLDSLTDAADRQRLLSLASARPDRNITPQTVAKATPEQVRGELSALGTGANLANRQRTAPAAPAQSGTLVPSDPNDLSKPFVPASSAPATRQAPKIPDPVAATNPNLPANFDLPMRNVAVAAGPNISTAPNQNPNLAQHGGLPEGSTGYQRKDGGYTVRTADGQTRDFASEAEARAAFSPPVFDSPYLRSTLNAVDQAKKDLIGSRSPSSVAGAPSQPKAAVPAAAAPSTELAPAYTLKGAGQRVGQAAAFLATDQTEANPANFLDTFERYGAATLGAAYDGSWQVPKKGLIRQGVEAVAGADPTVQNLGTAIGAAQAQARQREAIAAGRIIPDFNERAAQAAARYRRGPSGAPSLAEMEAAAVPVAPVAVQPNGAPTFAQMQSEAVPVTPVAPAPVSPAIQAVVAAATQPPRPAPTPTNDAPPLLRRSAPRFAPPQIESFTASEPGAFPPLLRTATGPRPFANITAFR